MPISKSDQPIALDRAHLGSRLDRSRGQSSVLESWRSLGSPQLPGSSFPAYESPPTANRRVHWWGFTTLQDGSRRILPPVRLGAEPCVKNIVYTWIIFMSRQWREVNIWPTQKLVRYFSPCDFKVKFPCTRIIIDGTKKPKAPRAQQATFSTYKNKNTVKVLVGCTPGGLINFVSHAYGGSTSDRQIVERCNIIQLCDRNDSVMADKGFSVQDLFASKDISVNVPNFFKKKNRLSCKTVAGDRKISSKRVHIERLIGLGKTYKILKCCLNGSEAKLSSDIIFVCFMLCNFRTGIVPSFA